MTRRPVLILAAVLLGGVAVLAAVAWSDYRTSARDRTELLEKVDPAHCRGHAIESCSPPCNWTAEGDAGVCAPPGFGTMPPPLKPARVIFRDRAKEPAFS